MNENQTLAIQALREAPEEIRLQGQAYRDGRMCACAVIVNALRPGLIDFSENSADFGGGDTRRNAVSIYDTIEELIGRDWRTVATLNDKIVCDDGESFRPTYTFAQLGDELEARWSK